MKKYYMRVRVINEAWLEIEAESLYNAHLVAEKKVSEKHDDVDIETTTNTEEYDPSDFA